ncbi:4Fe-4S cluster-binding domain-containing protein [Duncaniella dubosii]|uniref:4Fe-4S cluster-binding domain-containing protein n=1 Tax=Duncaniella dubosii TaxID=2518971 RepID=UPI003F661FD9
MVPGTSVDGPGLRTSIYFAGCSHQCPGCPQPTVVDFAGAVKCLLTKYGYTCTKTDLDETLSGGESDV